MPWPWTTTVRSALPEYFLIRFKLILIWTFPCELSSFARKFKTISIIVKFFSHVIFFFLIQTEAHTTCIYRLCTVGTQEQQVQQRCISACHMICSETLSCESWCAAFSLWMPVQWHKAWCCCKSTGKLQEKREVCCNTEDQKTMLKEGRDLQTIIVQWISLQRTWWLSGKLKLVCILSAHIL